jgi:hypothetical protein
MKDRLLTFLGFLLFLVSLPFLIVLLIVYIIPVVIVESIRESKVYKTEAKRYQLEQPLITIGVMDDNKEAKKVYDHMFKYLHHNEDGHWYAICDRRRNND